MNALESKMITLWKPLVILSTCIIFVVCAYISLPNNDLFAVFKIERSEEVESLEALRSSLERASMPNRTVIITTVNAAWAKPQGLASLFMESFKAGNGTEHLLKNLLIVALDDKSFDWCNAFHPHCYLLKSHSDFSQEEVFMSHGYVDLMWARIFFLRNVLSLGYSFVFTDADILWLRNPFEKFSKEEEFQIASDYFRGDHWDKHSNIANGGFTYVRSTKKTQKFYSWWYECRKLFPRMHDQDVFNKIKTNVSFSDIGLRIYFLDTKYFSGFCQRRADFATVYTMHANCCKGLKAKVADLTLILQDWKNFSVNAKKTTPVFNYKAPWRAPKACLHSW